MPARTLTPKPSAPPPSTRTVIYARVSSKEQEKEGYSIPAQLKLLKDYAAAEGFENAYDTVISNCSMCHAREPVWGNMQWAPKGVYLETPGDVARHAEQIYLQAGVSHAMPPPNAVQMDEEARRSIVAWVREVRRQ